MLTAACCIIGDEILSGKTKDTNSHYLANKLFDLGIELKTIQVIGDDSKTIQKSVKELSGLYDYVFTSGGIGPTHDDITYASIAEAYGLELKLDLPTYQTIERQLQKRQKPMTEAHARIATFPYPAQLIRDTMIPIVVVQNIYILPGVPRLFRLLVDALEGRLASGSRFYRQEIATAEPEVAIAAILRRYQAVADKDQIKIGSYPLFEAHPDQIKVIVSVSGKDQGRVSQLTEEIQREIKGWIYEKRESSL